MLLASSPTFDGIQACIKDFYMGEQKTLVPNGKIWEIYGSKGKLHGLIVRYKAKRYRFEYETKYFNEIGISA